MNVSRNKARILAAAAGVSVVLYGGGQAHADTTISEESGGTTSTTYESDSSPSAPDVSETSVTDGPATGEPPAAAPAPADAPSSEVVQPADAPTDDVAAEITPPESGAEPSDSSTISSADDGSDSRPAIASTGTGSSGPTAGTETDTGPAGSTDGSEIPPATPVPGVPSAPRHATASETPQALGSVDSNPAPGQVARSTALFTGGAVVPALTTNAAPTVPSLPETPHLAFLAFLGLPLVQGGGTTAAAPAPLALLAWVRRFGNTSPQAAAAPTVNAYTNGQVTGNLNVTDPDRDTLRHTVTDTPDSGSVTVNADGTFVYTPSAALKQTGGIDTFIVRSSDNTNAHIHGLASIVALFTGQDPHSRTTRVAVTVPSTTPVNQLPTLAVTGQQNTTETTTGTLVASDGDNDPLTYTVSGVAYTRGQTAATGKGVFVWNSDNTFTYTPSSTARHQAAADIAASADKADTIVVGAADGRGGTTTTTISAPIVGLNSPLSQGGPTSSIDRPTGTTTGTLGVTDADDVPTYVVTTAPTHGSVVVHADGAFTYTPDGQDKSITPTDSFTVTVNDRHGSTAVVPVAVDAYPRYFHDIDPTNQFWDPSDADDGSSVVVADPSGKVIYNVDANGNLVVRNTSSTPIAVIHSTYAANFSPTGVQGYTIVAPGGSATLPKASTSTGYEEIAVQGPRDELGIPVSLGNILRNGSGAIVNSSIPRVNAVPTAAVSDQQNTATLTTGTLLVADADNDRLTFAVNGSAYTRGHQYTSNQGTFIWNADGSFTITPSDEARHQASADAASSADKSATFTVTVLDGQGGATPVVISAPLVAENSAPTVSVTTPGTPNVITGLSTGSIAVTDSDDSSHTITVRGAQPVAGAPGTYTTAKGTVTIDPRTGAYTYAPSFAARTEASRFDAVVGAQSETLTFDIDDGHGGTAEQTVVVTVQPLGVPHSAIGEARAGADGSIYQSSYTYDGETNPYTTYLTVIRPDGTATTTDLGRGTYAGATPQVASDGTMYGQANAPQDSITGEYSTYFIRALPGGRYVHYEVPGSASGVQVGPDDFAYLTTSTSNDNMVRVFKLGQTGDPEMVAEMPGNASGSVRFAADGTMYQTTEDRFGTSTTVVRFPADRGTSTSTALVGGTASGVQEGVQFAPDGSAYQTTRTSTGSRLNRINVDGTATTIAEVVHPGVSNGAARISVDGSVFQSSYDNTHDYVTRVAVDGSTATTTLPGAAVGTVKVAPDGTAYQVSRSESGDFTTFITRISPDGTVTQVTKPGFGYTAVQIAPDGTVYQTSSADDEVRVTRFNTDGTTTSIILAGHSSQGVVIAPDGTAYQWVRGSAYSGNSRLFVVSGSMSSPSVSDGALRL